MSIPSVPLIPSSPSERAALAAVLALELSGLRNALITLSLSLKDWQFEMDKTGRSAAQQQASQLLAACRARPRPPTA
jgi:hypothetical protein